MTWGAILISAWAVAVPQAAPVRVVTTLPVYAELVREVGGAEVEVSSIASPNEDAHFVRPKPSFALALRRADAFVTTGLDLELWVPTLLDRAGNTAVLEGGRGYITAYTGIQLLDIPVAADRGTGDVHIFGNPHLTTDPLRTLQIARNITVGLKRVAPDRADHFDRGLADLAERIHRRLFGDRLIELLGAETLEQLALGGNLFDFLEDNEFEGVRLIDELGGWLAAAEPLSRWAAHLLPQELGVSRGSFSGPLRGLRRVQTGHSPHSGPCGPAHRPHAKREPERAPGCHLFRRRQGGDRRKPWWGDARPRAAGARRRPGHGRLLLTRRCLGRRAGPGIPGQLNR